MRSLVIRFFAELPRRAHERTTLMALGTLVLRVACRTEKQTRPRGCVIGCGSFQNLI
jgi:hypothetical protein